MLWALSVVAVREENSEITALAPLRFSTRHKLVEDDRRALVALQDVACHAFEQRWFHLAEEAPAGQPPSQTRFLFEIRVVQDRWYLDAFTRGPGYNHTLIFPERLYPCGQWFHVAQTFDGTMYRSYVDGVLQGEHPIAFKPQGPGRASVGCRINRLNSCTGAVRQARFTHAALPPERFTRG